MESTPPPQEPVSSSICRICKDHLLIITDTNSGETICSKCGVIVSDKVQNIHQPEWRAFSNEEHENRSRTGIPSSLAIHDMGLATVIGRADRDATGKKIRPCNAYFNAKAKDMGFKNTC